MEVAFTIAEHINLATFFDEAVADARIYTAISLLMDTLITEPNPLGGIDHLSDGDEVLSQYLRMLAKRPPDIRMLNGLHITERYLHSRERKDDGAILSNRVHQLWSEAFNDNVIRAGLGRSDTRWIALNLIRELRLNTVLPEVREAFLREADYASISVLAELGNEEDLQILCDAIPKVVDLKSRLGKKLSAINVHGPESNGAFQYSRIIEAIGRLATPEAIAKMKLAAGDYDPMVRQSACKAFERMPLDKVDEEIARLIHERLHDPTAYVREAAKQASSRLVV